MATVRRFAHWPITVYRGAEIALRPGEFLCAVTDGVTEARNPGGALYGSARVGALLPEIGRGNASARKVVETLRADVETFVAGAEPSDDLTILALRWHGPGAGA
jgi:serine phosphatase RsbU (regulator of sigma subunit)